MAHNSEADMLRRQLKNAQEEIATLRAENQRLKKRGAKPRNTGGRRTPKAKS